MARTALTSYLRSPRRKGGGLLAAGAIALAGAAAIVHRRTLSAERAHPARGAFVTVDGVRLHYIERGRGGPVVFLHGNGVTSEDFRVSGLLGSAGNSYRALAFDRPGFGYSERPWTRSWPASAQADLLPGAFRILGLERPIIVGHSWGAMVALALALDHPDCVSGLVLVSGYYYPTARADVALFSPPAIPLLGDVLRYTLAPFVGEALNPSLIRKMFAPLSVPGSFWEDFPVNLMTRPSQIRAAAEDAVHMVTSAYGLSKRYNRLTCPVAILAGDSDQIVDHEHQALRLNRDLSESTLNVCSGAGHMLHYSHMAEVTRAIDLINRRIHEPAKSVETTSSA